MSPFSAVNRQESRGALALGKNFPERLDDKNWVENTTAGLDSTGSAGNQWLTIGVFGPW